MRVVTILISMLLILSLQPITVVADTSVDNGSMTDGEETTRGFVFIIIGTILGAIGYKSGKRVWSSIDESEENSRSQYYLSENLMKLSVILLLIGFVLVIGGISHIL